LLDSCTALTEVSAGENATDEQTAALQKAIFGKEIVITQQPADVTVGEGGTANIEVQLESTEGLSFTWYVRNAKDKDFTVDAAQTGSIYSIVADASCDGRMVYCVIGDDYGTTAETDAAMISIAAPVQITKQPEGATLPEGAQANVTIEVAGESPVYAWYVNDVLYADCTGNVFNAPMTAELDGAQVYCVVTDAYGKSASSQKAVLKLAAQLAITAQPATAELPEGEMTNITVEATGDGLTYQWYVMPVSKSEFAVAEGFNTNVYSVPVDFDSDWSQVYCVITDAYGNSVTSETASIFIAASDEPAAPAAPAAPAGAVDASLVGHWVTTKADLGGMVVEGADLETYGLNMWIDLAADGTASMLMEGEEYSGITWGVADGMLYLTLFGDTMTMQVPGDGTLNMDGIIFEMGAAAEATVEETSEDEMSDEELLALLAALAELEEGDDGETAEPAAATEGGFAGTWYMCYISTGGLIGDLRSMGINSTLILNADGTGSIDFPDAFDGIWYEENGFAYFGQGGDEADMPIALLDGGFLQYGSDLGGYLIFSQDKAANWDPSMGTAQIAAGIEEPAATAVPAAPAGEAVDASQRMNSKFVAASYTSFGQTMDASMLGAEYALYFREDGTCDFTMGGVAIPNLPWNAQMVDGAEAYVINYYGALFNAVLTETGFDMDFYGTMNLHFVPAE
ncbi:MAG: hypothetical protein IJA26_06055, partial [Clostridia bacterium]|nr:hypothetical protein [Clostridia bacterium]